MYNSCANIIVNIQKNTANVRKVEVNYEEFSVFSVDENISLSIGCR